MRVHAIFGGIGSFAVKFRWLVILVWVVAAVGVPRALPSLSSVTQGNNANFLPASAPSEHAPAAGRAAGGVDPHAGAGRRRGRPRVPLTPADAGLAEHGCSMTCGTGAHRRRRCVTSATRPTARRRSFRCCRPSAAAAAAAGSPRWSTTCAPRSPRRRRRRPGWQVHLAGDGRDQRRTSSPSRAPRGTEVEVRVAVLFILVLLLLIFRVAACAADHTDPGILRRSHLRAAGRRGGARGPEGLAARSAPADRAGARRGHRLRPVPGLPGPREPARRGGSASDAVRSRGRHGSASRSRSPPLTVIARPAVPARRHLRASTPSLGIPLAIGIGADAARRAHAAARAARGLRPGGVLAEQDPARVPARPASGAGSRSRVVRRPGRHR